MHEMVYGVVRFICSHRLRLSCSTALRRLRPQKVITFNEASRNLVAKAASARCTRSMASMLSPAILSDDSDEMDSLNTQSTAVAPRNVQQRNSKASLLRSYASHMPPTHSRALNVAAMPTPIVVRAGDSHFKHAMPSFSLVRMTSGSANCYNIAPSTSIIPVTAADSVATCRTSESDDDQRAPIKYRLSSPVFDNLFTPELQHVADLFKKYGFEMRIAGGAVRDILLGKLPHDVDFATNATPDQMKDMFEKEVVRTINLGAAERHGTITARINDKENFEITTLRIETDNDGRWAQVQWTKDWFLDACRRDLTINAMFLGLDGVLYDYFGGLDDLQAKRIRFVGKPRVRLQEDYLRIMRYFRFFSRIAEKPYHHDEPAIEAIRSEAAGLARISGERIWSEWQKIIANQHAAMITEKMHELGVTQHMGLNADINLGELSKVCLRSSQLSPLPITLVAALLRTLEDVDALNKRLKMSNDQRNLARFIVQWRSAYADVAPRRVSMSSADGVAAGDSADDLARAQFFRSLVMDSSTSEVKEQPKRQTFAAELAKYVGDAESLRDLESWVAPKFPVRTERLLALNKITHPYMCGRAVEGLRRRWIDSSFQLTEDELLDQPLDEIIAAIKAEPAPTRRGGGGGGGGGVVDKKLAKSVFRNNKRRKEEEKARKASATTAESSEGEEIGMKQ